MSTSAAPAVDMNKLNAFIGQFVTDLGASVHAGMVVIGDKLGLYKALATGPMSSAELAARTQTDERYVREWLGSREDRLNGGKTMTSTLLKLSLAASCLLFVGMVRANGHHATHARASSAAAPQQKQANEQGGPDNLVNIVRNATKQYVDNVEAAESAGFGAALGCVSGSDHGAMGIHYVNGSLVNGPIDPTHPQALIYEPSSNGQLKLVGVEFIILASALPPIPPNAPPQVDGHLMVFVDAPNRYGLPPFYELHVWAWRDNPQGPFVDWNDHVSCAGQ
jgi:hypothetical protein